MADLPNNPNNREEEYLARAAGLPNDAPDNPWSRKEAYLEKIGGRIDEAEEDISELDEKVAALATDISLKGSVADYAHLPTDAAIGDAYITEDTGILYVWVGSEWVAVNDTGVNVVQTTGTSTTDVMSQNAATKLVWADKANYKIAIGESITYASGSTYDIGIGKTIAFGTSTTNAIAIGNGSGTGNSASGGTAIGAYSSANGSNAVALGGDYSYNHKGAKAYGTGSIAIGTRAQTGSSTNSVTSSICIGTSSSSSSNNCVSIGTSAKASSAYAKQAATAVGASSDAQAQGSIALGAYSTATNVGEMNIGSSDTSYGYSSSNYRLLSGLYDPQSAHDAATKGYVDTHLGGLTFVALTQTEYDNLGTKDPNTLYIIKAA